MTPEIRRAALRMAAKTALVMSIGCSSGTKTAPPPSNADHSGSSAPATSAQPCPEYLGSLATAQRGQLKPDDPLHGKFDVYAAFADVAVRSAPQTQTCCTEELVKHGSGAAARFECCSALGHVPEGAERSACTPWGPPCPPEMACEVRG